MKTNPTCERADCPKTFSDSLNFCQICGSTLVATIAEDPYKTVVAAPIAPSVSEPKPMAAEFDPLKTVVAPRIPEEDVLQIPEFDPMKTMVAPTPPKTSENIAPPTEVVKPIETPPPAPSFPSPFSEPMPPIQNSSFNQPLDSPIFGALDNNANQPNFNDSPLPSASEPNQWNQQQQTYEPPPFQSPTFQEPEPQFQQVPFNQPAYQNQQMDQQWTPPPAPVSNWQNQGINQNTPFNAPPIGQGQDQTMAIISLVLGCLSLCCYIGWLTGPIAFFLGWKHRKNVAADPNRYGGDGLALAGMIVGGILGGIWVVVVALYVIFIVLAIGASSIH